MIDKILVVDDNDVLREVMPEILNALGYDNIDTASNGEEGLNKYAVADSVYNLVISDIIMPGMNGIEMYEKIKESEKSINCPNFLFMLKRRG